MKTKRYWLRGGVIGLAVFAVYDLITYFIQEPCVSVGNACYDKIKPIIIPISNFFSSIDVFYYLISPFIEGVSWFGKEFYHVFTIWPSVILIGIIIGYLYGKIKNKYEK